MMRLLHFNTNRFHGLDHLRAIAILMVMIFHYGKGVPPWLEPVKQIGWTGVDLFFVLSGYLIGYQLLKEYKKTGDLNFRHFYIKRFFRIIPVYIAVLVLYYAMPNLREGSGMPPLWRFLTFTQNFGLDAQHQKSFSHAWSLCVEEQFYFILPITILTVFRFKLPKTTPYMIIGLFIIGFLSRIYNWNEYVLPFIDIGDRRQMVFGFQEKVFYPSYNRMDGLLVGVGIAAIFNFRPKIKDFLIRHGNIMLIIGLALFFLAYKVCDNLISYRAMIFGLPLISITYGVILIAAISPTSIMYKIKTKFTLIIATLSYAIYLTHKQVYHLVKLWIEYTGYELSEGWIFWICVALAILCGLLLHIMIEKPFFILRKKAITRYGHINAS